MRSVGHRSSLEDVFLLRYTAAVMDHSLSVFSSHLISCHLNCRVEASKRKVEEKVMDHLLTIIYIEQDSMGRYRRGNDSALTLHADQITCCATVDRSSRDFSVPPSIFARLPEPTTKLRAATAAGCGNSCLGCVRNGRSVWWWWWH